MGSKVKFWAVSGSTSWPGLAWVTFARQKVVRAGWERTALIQGSFCVCTLIFLVVFVLPLDGCRDAGVSWVAVGPWLVQQQVPVGQVVQEVPAEPHMREGFWWDAGAVKHLLLSLVFQELWCAVGGTGCISDFTNWKLSKIITTRQRWVRAAARGFVTRRRALRGLAGFLGSSRPLLARLP